MCLSCDGAAASVAGGGKGAAWYALTAAGSLPSLLTIPRAKRAKEARKRGEAERERERRRGGDREKCRTDGGRMRHKRGRGRKDIAIIIK